MARRRILLICYYFPPLGGPGIGRPLALFEHLPNCGCDCDVLTVKAVAYRVFEPELLRGPDTDRIYRAGSGDPQRLLRLLGVRKIGDTGIRHSRGLFARCFPDHLVGWVGPAVRLGRKLAGKNRYDAVLSTSPPMSCHLVAQRIAAACNLPWIADFRDFWTSYRIEDHFSHQGQIDKAWTWIQSIQEQASVVTAGNPAIADYLQAGEVIFNSFDERLAALWHPPRQDAGFTVGLLGTFNEMVPIDPLFKAMAAMQRKTPDSLNKVKLLQVGQVDNGWFRSQLETYDLQDICRMHGFRRREESIRILSAASLFYLGLAPSHESGVIPGRLFVLLASGRPILAAVGSESEVGKLITASGNGFCFDSGEAASLEAAGAYIGQLVRSWESGELNVAPLPEYAQEYSAGNMAKRFAQIVFGL